MSNLNAGGTISTRTRKAIRSQLNYEEVCSACSGEMTISGLELPENAKYDVLAKIWSSVKRRIEETYHVSITATFQYADTTDGPVKCQFYLNYAPVENQDQEVKAYEARFVETFHLSMLMFEEALESFMLDTENGFAPYCECVESSTTKYDAKTMYNICERMLNDFLFSSRLKKAEDEKKKGEIAAAAQKVRSAAF